MGTNLECAIIAVRIGSRIETVLSSLARSPNGRTRTSSVFWSSEYNAKILKFTGHCTKEITDSSIQGDY